MFALFASTFSLVCLMLSGCGGDTTTTVKPLSCGTLGGGTQPCLNNAAYTCTNCGSVSTSGPCIDAGGGCWSCYGADGNCHAYACSTLTGLRCYDTPCLATCGTEGGGVVPTVNQPSLTCSNCGPAPCVDSAGQCHSCYGADGNCYPYVCNGGDFCQTAPCGYLRSDGNVTRVPAWKKGDAVVATAEGEALDGGAPAMLGEAPESFAFDDGSVPASVQADDDVSKSASFVPV